MEKVLNRELPDSKMLFCLCQLKSKKGSIRQLNQIDVLLCSNQGPSTSMYTNFFCKEYYTEYKWFRMVLKTEKLLYIFYPIEYVTYEMQYLDNLYVSRKPYIHLVCFGGHYRRLLQKWNWYFAVAVYKLETN